MPVTGSGAGQASGGASSDSSMGEYMTEQPHSHFDKKHSVYRKVHKVMTFGIAPSVLDGTQVSPTGGTSDVWLGTYLAEVPWHLPVFYLNQSEFLNLQNGAHCEEVSIEIYYRGSTIQFETASTASGLATLNQINDVGVAHGLNRTGWGSNIAYSGFGQAAMSQSMLPNKLRRPQYQQEVTGAVVNYKGVLADYYGQDNQGTQFKGWVPNHQVGRQVFLRNYFAMSTRASQQSANSSNMWGGWPCLAEKIQQMDGKTVVNTCISKSTYKPKMGQLNTPLKHLGGGLPYPVMGATNGVNVQGNLVAARTMIATRDSLDTTNANDGMAGDRWTSLNENLRLLGNDDNGPANVQPTWGIYTPIEKSQDSHTGFWGSIKPHIQPSCHVGIQPIPSLSTANYNDNPGDSDTGMWTDCRGYFEIIATMKVVEYTPTHLPFANVANVPQGDCIFQNSMLDTTLLLQDPRNDGATFAGLYQNQKPDLNMT